MVETVKRLMEKYREQWSYLVVGVCTTAVNFLIYTPLVAFIPFFSENYQLANAIAWVGAVAFAYFANGTFVYRSAQSRSVKEAGAFVLSRVFTLILETLLLTLLVDVCALNSLLAKLVGQVVVTVTNYLTGKLVFQKR